MRTARSGPGDEDVLLALAFFQSARALAAIEDHLPAGQAEAPLKALGHEQSHMGEADQAAVTQQQAAGLHRLEQPRQTGELLTRVRQDDALADESAAGLH